MKMKLKPLIVIFLIFYFIDVPLREILETGGFTTIQYAFQNLPIFLIFLSNLILFFAFSIGAYLLFFKTYTKDKKYLSFSLLIPVCLAIIFIRYLLQEVLGSTLFGGSNYSENFPIQNYLFDNIYYAIMYGSLGIVIFFMQYSQDKELQQREQLFQHQKTELAFLRSQINPHFLFNILNNIYTLIYYKSDNALRSVEKLSTLLRYALYEKAEKVSLKKEMTHLHDFIELQKMRFDYELAWQEKVEPGIETLQIPPLTLLPFVENAFKHGNLKNPKQPAQMKMQRRNQHLEFTVSNEKLRQEKDEIGGIGVANIQKRLQLIYGQHANLTISETEKNYSIHLKIALSVC